MTIKTADGKVVDLGDRVFNYYDMKAGTIIEIDSHPQPDTMKGQNSNTPIGEWSNYWFDVRHDDESRAGLDGSRICTIEFAKRKGWL